MRTGDFQILGSGLLDRTMPSLVLAVKPLDPAGMPPEPLGRMEVALSGEGLPVRNGIRNPGGYYLFLGIAGGAYRLTLTGAYYREIEVDLALPLAAPFPAHPDIVFTAKTTGTLLELLLVPRPFYPFPADATVVDVEVRRVGTGIPAGGASLRVADDLGGAAPALSFRADGRGLVTLFCNRMRRDAVNAINGRAFGGSRQLRLTAQWNGAAATVVKAVTEFKRETVVLEV